ncbi:hypothetical protein SKAU_G00147040 [Synaphobranchus kaupii]|uniref:Uncharacterized protein n=1 Tax=Synaphobranchus kaupii TaxID=118154 RepID=A0A9Q1FUG4_SYNKA|nr:hypothetical protein SKAU_G00147040 [Synaphobranchus kaupii]
MRAPVPPAATDNRRMRLRSKVLTACKTAQNGNSVSKPFQSRGDSVRRYHGHTERFRDRQKPGGAQGMLDIDPQPVSA